MTSERFIELANDYDHNWTREEVDEACELMLYDAEGLFELNDEVCGAITSIEQVFPEYNEKINECLQKYLLYANGAEEGLKRVNYPFFLCQMETYLIRHGLENEALIYIDELMDCNYYTHLFQYNACGDAIDIFLRSGKINMAGKYINMAEDMFRKEKSLYRQDPLDDDETAYIAVQLARCYIALGDLEKYELYHDYLVKIKDTELPIEHGTVERFLMTMEARFEPLSRDIWNRLVKCYDDFQPMDDEVIRLDVELIDVLKRYSGFVSDRELADFIVRMIDKCPTGTDTVLLYRVLTEDRHADCSEFADIYERYYKELETFYVNTRQGQKDSVLNFITRTRMEYDFKKRAQMDNLTGFWSKLYYDEVLRGFACRKPKGVTVFMIDANALKYVNDHFGHEAGNTLLFENAKILKRVFPEETSFYRAGGDEFIAHVRLFDKSPDDIVRRVHEACEALDGKYEFPISVSLGYAVGPEHPELSYYELVHMADEMMYADKNRFYSTHEYLRRK